MIEEIEVYVSRSMKLFLCVSFVAGKFTFGLKEEFISVEEFIYPVYEVFVVFIKAESIGSSGTSNGIHVSIAAQKDYIVFFY